MLRPLADHTYESPTRHAFLGRLMAAEEGRFRDQYGAEELVLRTRPDCPIESGDEMYDETGRRLLLLDFDRSFVAKTFRLVQLNELMSWARTGTVTDPVTKAKRQDVNQALGDIWVGLSVVKEVNDSAVNVKQDLRRAITRHPLQLQDKLGKFTVQRVNHTLGVYVAEVQ